MASFWFAVTVAFRIGVGSGCLRGVFGVVVAGL